MPDLYTPDGLLHSIYEPAIETGSSGEVRTKYYTYGKRPFPITLSEAAGPDSGALTTYEYDWRGNVVETTLPTTQDVDGADVAATVTQTYDENGNLMMMVDAEGFVTTYWYNKYNRLETEQKLTRNTTTIDNKAFPESGGPRTDYWYDAAGNLIGEERGTLYTHYAYNSLGKVIVESRPSTASSADSNRKLKTYRLDGALTAHTTYDYRGSLTGAGTSTVAKIGPSNLPTVTKLWEEVLPSAKKRRKRRIPRHLFAKSLSEAADALGRLDSPPRDGIYVCKKTTSNLQTT